METLARTCAAALLATLLCAAPDAPAQGTPEPLVPEVVRIPLPGETTMVAQVFRPSGEGPFPVLVFSHGRAGTDFERRSLANPFSILFGFPRLVRRHVRRAVCPSTAITAQVPSAAGCQAVSGWYRYAGRVTLWATPTPP
jgi:hypothetical protein